MTPNEKAAFIMAQTEIMRSERILMESENEDRSRRGFAPANGPSQWAEFHTRWESVLGYNALISFFRE